jgi:DNA polymerase-3 subunit gamma/tau
VAESKAVEEVKGVEPGEVAKSEVEAQAERAAEPIEPRVATVAPRRRTTASSFSITNILQRDVEAEMQAESQPQNIVIDADSERKIEASREAVVSAVAVERPRFVASFEAMRIEGNVIKIEVPSKFLYEEIMRSKIELLTMIARTAGVNGTLDLDITVNEQIKASRPIKLEDRAKFLSEKNPHLMDLKRILDMEYE